MNNIVLFYIFSNKLKRKVKKQRKIKAKCTAKSITVSHLFIFCPLVALMCRNSVYEWVI